MILDGRKRESMVRAVETILSGGIVGFPTETVYGLGADAFNDEAVKKIFKLKNRPLADPLILHIADHKQLYEVASEVSELALKLIGKFWPGPLTLIFKKKSKVSPLLTAGLETVAVRMPRNIIATSLIKNTGTIIAAPSANKFQSISPTTAQAVDSEFGSDLEIILDGGPCLVGLESTIISVVKEPKILRLGGLSIEEIEKVLGIKLSVERKSGDLAKGLEAPGMMEFHYAPKKPLTLIKESVLESEFTPAYFTSKAVICFSEIQEAQLLKRGATDIHVLSKSGNMQEAARNYFETLRKIDHSDLKGIICIEVPEEFLGRALNDRLRRAQHR